MVDNIPTLTGSITSKSVLDVLENCQLSIDAAKVLYFFQIHKKNCKNLYVFSNAFDFFCVFVHFS